MPRRGKSIFSLFRHPTFALILCSAAISNIGNWMEGVAQGWAVIEQTQGDPVKSAFLSELLSVADFAPVLMLALAAGVIADRVNRKAWLFILQFAAFLLAASLAAAGYLGLLTPFRVIAWTFAEGVVWALNGPVWMAVIPALVDKEELPLATVANSMQFNLARLVGPVLAGFIIGAAGVNLAFAINAATFIPVLFALTRLPPTNSKRSSDDAGIMADLFSGLRFVRTHPGLRSLAMMSVAFMFFSAPLQGLLAIFARQVLNGGASLYGVMLAMIGLGSVTGAMLLGRVPEYYPRHHLIPVSMCAFCGFGLAYGFSTHIWLSLPLLFFCGIFWLLTLNSMSTASQLLTTDEYRGRVMSIMLLCTQGVLPLGHLCAGALAHLLSPQGVLLAMFAAMMLITLIFIFIREPAIDNMKRGGAEFESLSDAVREALTAESHRPARSSDSVRLPPPGAPP